MSDTKYTLLIADDEEIERRALKLLLKRSFPSLTIVADAANGNELIRIAQNEKPDIILADIEMPGMNGLEALANLRDGGCDAHVVIVTAYSSYKYAKESVSLHAFEFLEKPVKRNKVVEVIEKVIAQLDANRGKHEEVERMRQFIEQMGDVIRSELMMTIEMDETVCGQTERYLEMLDMSFKNGYIMTFLIGGSLDSRTQTPLQRSVSEMRVFEMIRGAFQGDGRISGHVFNHRLSCLVLLSNADTPHRMKAEALKLASDILDRLPNGDRGSIRIGIGSVVDTPEELSISYRESICALRAQGSIGSICHYGDVGGKAISTDPFHDAQTRILDSIRSCNRIECDKAANEVFNQVSGTIELMELQNRAVESMLFIQRQMDSVLDRGLSLIHSAQSEFGKVWETKNADEIREWYVSACVEFISVITRQGVNWQELVIERAKAYIHENYKNDISLEQTADAIGVSHYYLSRLFKAKAGVNYSAYLTELRIRRAAQLLERYEISARELAQQVGFNDSDYFGKVFKKVMGCTVSDFRAIKHH